MKDSTNEAKTEVQKDVSSETSIKVLVVVNDRKNLEGAIGYLENKNYKLAVVSTVSDMVQQIQGLKPNVVLLSWNLKNTPIDKVYRVLTLKFNLACLVFAEESATHSLNRLNRSGIPHPIIPPVMGPHLVMRIRSLLAQRQKPTIKKIPPKMLGKFLNWEQIEDPENAKEKIWKGVDSKQTSQSQIYYFRGPDRPKFNTLTQEWDFKGNSEVFIQEGVPASGSTFIDKNEAKNLELEMAALEKTDIPEEIEIERPNTDEQKLEFLSSLPTPTVDLAKSEKPEKVRSHPKVGLESILAEALKATLVKCKKLHPTKFNEKTEISKVMACVISSPRFCGYLLYATPLESSLRDRNKEVEEMITILREEMKTREENFSRDLEFFEIEHQPRQFLNWAREAADFVLMSQENEIALAYFSTSLLPQVIETDDESMLGISLKKDLIPNTILMFDVYLQFVENRKYLRYLCKGQFFTQEMLDKFKKFQVLFMFIKKSDRLSFFNYCAKNAIDI